MKWNKIFVLIVPITMLVCMAKPLVAQEQPDPRGAFLRSLALPGWGHHYADSENWRRGQVHLGTEAVLAASLFGFHRRASNLETQYTTLANLRSGVDITDRSRTFRLAIGEYNSLEEHNDHQLRSRNWDRLLDETAENNWNWQSESDRRKYNQLRSDRDRARNQLPAILGLMTLNRVVSAISAYNRARTETDLPQVSITPVLGDNNSTGVLTTISFQF